MKIIINTMLIALFVVMLSVSPAKAETVTIDEALTIAKNWVSLIIHHKGSWGDYEVATVKDIQEFKRGQRTLGYFCRVQPKGYIIISLRKELAPVKAYSATSNLDPEHEEGMADLIKDCMERIIKKIEKEVGPIDSPRTEDIGNILEINYRNAWRELEGDAMSFQQKLDSEIEPMNYQGGDPPLLSSDWHQGDPYNRDCPTPTEVGDPDCTALAKCKVGCVATAGAQIMRYWNWPPYGQGQLPGVRPGEVVHYEDSYDWPNMPDSADAGSSPAEKNAVAELCYEVGIAVNMDYCGWPGGDGCGSGANTYDMEYVFENQYRYYQDPGSKVRNRPDYTPIAWFERMKTQFNLNQPVQYRISGHSIVGDGWQETGSVPLREYHMNYGWTGTGDDIWYTLDSLGDPNEEYMLENIFPSTSVGSLLAADYPLNVIFPYRYFNLDAIGTAAVTTFSPGQNLQFLPGITVTCVNTSGGYIRFYSSDPFNTRLYTRGDTSRGVRIDSNGGIRLYQNGSIKLN
ncbi:MAG: C10 family peptidase [Planctomycetota bacterium]|jgi:hypothetical protein